MTRTHTRTHTHTHTHTMHQVAFAPVGAEVADEELGVGTTTIKAIKLKNVNSAGMLCSGKLLGLNEDGT